jgi:FkbM family methyltransferase
MTQPTGRPIAFVLASTDHGSLLVNRHDHARAGENEYGVGHQLLATSAYDAPEGNALRMLLERRKAHFGDGVVMIDCGANIGVHTVACAKAMHGWGEVVGIEAQERIFYALAGNITLNNCFNARAIWAAVGAESGTLRIPTPDYLTPASYGSLELRKTETTEYIGQAVDYGDGALSPVRMVAVDDLGLTRVDLIKIDIEGMEIEALNGARETLERFKPCLMVERIKAGEDEIKALMTGLGYRVMAMGPNLLAIHETDPAAQQVKVLAP